MINEIDSRLRRSFLALLRSGLWGSEPDCSLFPLREKEWEKLYMLARQQTVEGVVYDGILRLPPRCLPPFRFLATWTAVADEIERRNERMNCVLEQLSRRMSERGISAWLMKGQGTALCYDQPLHRRCGDIDLYFPDAADGAIMLRMMQADGVSLTHTPGWSVTYPFGSFCIDQHSRAVDIHNPWKTRYIKELIQAEVRNCVPWNAEMPSLLLPSPLLAHLVVNTHILKHLMAVGVGFRQLCDSARICKYYNGSVCGKELEQMYHRLGIYRWVQTLNRVLMVELGMEPEYLPFPLSHTEEAEWMRDVWSGGNFGFYDQRLGHASIRSKKKRVADQLLYHLWPQMRYAPAEAFWFPLMQFYSRYCKKRL